VSLKVNIGFENVSLHLLQNATYVFDDKKKGKKSMH